MGIFWKSAMPLLSTLAALVIIVHSAEEDLDSYELTPDRQFNTRSPSYEQAWRVKEFEHLNPEAQTEALDYYTPEEPPVRRRPGRKRKRPLTRLTESTEHDISQHRYTSIESSSMRDETIYDDDEVITEAPRRRRKRPNLRPNRWTDEVSYPERPFRRRLKSRKPPTPQNSWPSSREIGAVYPEDLPNFDMDKAVRSGDSIPALSKSKYAEYEPQERDSENIRPLMKDDRSLSELSMEDVNPKHQAIYNEKPALENQNKYKIDNSKDRENIDPQALMKEILKRSNGTSLSEILQQHNLTLADLLNGKEYAISVLKKENLLQTEERSMKESILHNSVINELATEISISEENADKITNKALENKSINETNVKENHSQIENRDRFLNKNNNSHEIAKTEISEESPTNINVTELNHNISLTSPAENSSRIMAKRRFPGGVRRKLRMKPMMNNTYKSQLSRDLIALSARKYYNHNRRNVTKAREWKGMIPLMINISSTASTTEPEGDVLYTTISVPTETTTSTNVDDLSPSTIYEEILTTLNDEGVETEKPKTDNIAATTTIKVEILATDFDIDVTEKPTTTPVIRSTVSVPSLRRQAFNNRLKKKRLKHKSSTTEAPQNDILKNILNMGDFVSSSEFIARTQLPSYLNPDINKEIATELEDFFTTESSRSYNGLKSTEPSVKSSKKASTATKLPFTLSTEETAKIEIEEILNDTLTSAKLSRILKERNMTLNELLDHRERGSSNVHLADIFHNASREPNPPEPFLSKSLIEPISKETYPLRALLEANLHDPAVKVTTDVNSLQSNHINIPMRMDFGNNVNENAENMGIISLFNNFTKELEMNENSTLQKDSEGTPYKSMVINVNATDDDENTARESRIINDDQDMVSWNDIFAMIRKNKNNETKEYHTSNEEISPSVSSKKTELEEDVDGDGLIVLEDLQNLNNHNEKVTQGSEERIQFNSYEQIDVSHDQGILNKPPNSMKSVTVATASIVGLAMIFFLLTYAALKWKQQRSLNQKNTFCDERIPTPVFENRKVKKNCSSRSISPMLPQSNIYTMSTLESQNGKDSPEYMWDTLRKPFQ